MNETEPTRPPETPAEKVLRLRRANREQVVAVPAYLDALIEENHLARLIWRTPSANLWRRGIRIAADSADERGGGDASP